VGSSPRIRTTRYSGAENVSANKRHRRPGSIRPTATRKRRKRSADRGNVVHRSPVFLDVPDIRAAAADHNGSATCAHVQIDVTENTRYLPVLHGKPLRNIGLGARGSSGRKRLVFLRDKRIPTRPKGKFYVLCGSECRAVDKRIAQRRTSGATREVRIRNE